MVEDEAFVALAIAGALEDEGAEVAGPAATIGEALDLAKDVPCDAAILDIDLGGIDVFPAADVLRAKRVPFLFHTGHGTRRELKRDYPGAPVCKKPMSIPDLVGQVARLIEGGDETA
ncbi:response regulator [Parvularcula lutaonensis]|uniref:Response regulator n=1 Tax=Parvularcula lutaonensis TaxID=491923 RepID=A0ABV7M742_9PROT|nr:hypothetical protein [Parvularcula lutaonensis]GGY56596.1 response regulator [Parvularcula lutaonensis]